EAMDGDERRALYALLRPDGVVVETLLQYDALHRQHSPQAAAAAAAAEGGDGWLAIGGDSLPGEWRGQPGAAAAYLKAHAPAGVRVVASPGAVELRVGALEYVVYHVCRALVPSRGLGVRHGALVAGSVVHCLARELISFFLPLRPAGVGVASVRQVAAPERPPAPAAAAAQGVEVADQAARSPMRQLRSRLHGAPGPGARRAGAGGADLLDACAGAQATGVAQCFAFCAALAWLPVGADAAAWAPSIAHVAGLNLFHAAVGYVAKGERQLERARAGGRSEGARVAMNAAVRDAVRPQLAGPLGSTLALVVAASRRPGAADAAEAWLPFLDEAVSTWLRYAMPWRSSPQNSAPSLADDGRLAEAWQLRVPLVVWSVGAPLYAPVLADVARLLAAPHVDLLARAPRSTIDDASALAHVRGADALGVVERIASAFAAPELRATLVAADRLWGLSHGPSLLSSPRFDALVGDATRILVSVADHAPPPPVADAATFADPRSALLKGLALALQRADRLCVRQLRLLAPPPVRAAEQAQTLVADLFAAAARVFSPPAPADAPTTAESAAARAHALRDAQRRISAVVPKLAAVFHASRAD
ncbi:hypothetical protein GGI00_004800, partial [Coemansia sp. RSA 2681]